MMLQLKPEHLVPYALVHTITDIGQLSPQQKRMLNAAAKKGVLSKGKGGPFPKCKTVYAHPGFDFAKDREESIREMFTICAALGESMQLVVRKKKEA